MATFFEAPAETPERLDALSNLAAAHQRVWDSLSKTTLGEVHKAVFEETINEDSPPEWHLFRDGMCVPFAWADERWHSGLLEVWGHDDEDNEVLLFSLPATEEVGY